MSDKIYSHAGDTGDLLAALPALASLGGGHLRLTQHPCTGYRMTPERAESLRPLLEYQPYVRSVTWSDQVEGEPLDKGVRATYDSSKNLADMQSAAFGVPHWDREQPWLFVPKVKRLARVVFHRSERYQNWNVVPTWKKAWEEYRHETLFIGTPAEHRDFCLYIGPVPYYPTKDWLELAQVVAGAELYCGNQSGPHWLASGLRVPLCLEVCPWCNNCHWHRYGARYWVNEGGEVPPLSMLEEWWSNNLAHRAHGHTLIENDRLGVIARSVRDTERLPGEMAELGTYQGGSAKVIGSVCPQNRLHLFDMFEGGIPNDDVLENGHHKGDFACPLDEVKAYLAGLNVEYHAGYFPQTAEGLEDRQYSFVHLDGDLYQTTKDGLEYFWPRMVSGGYIVFDDWKWKNCPGVEKAVLEAGLADLIEVTGPKQARVRKP